MEYKKGKITSLNKGIKSLLEKNFTFRITQALQKNHSAKG